MTLNLQLKTRTIWKHTEKNVSPVIHISKKYGQNDNITVCPGSSDSSYIVTYYMKWVTSSD